MNDEVFNLVRRSVVEHSMTDDERQLERLRITCDKVLPPMDYLFRIFGRPCFPRGELVAITGKAKSGKTLFNSMLMAEGSLSTNPIHVGEGRYSIPYLQRIQEEALRVLWYDTEQSEQSTQDILKNRVMKMAAGDVAFDVFNVRGLHYEERMRLFKTAVHKYKPALVVLDGVRDLLADINDGIRAQEMVEELMRLAQQVNCCMVCVLHQNKGAEDRNPRGWIGTELMNKAFEVYACEKVKPENIFVVEQTHTRKYDLDGLMFFRMDSETELPVACEAPLRYAATCGAATSQGEKLPYMNREYLTFDENNKPHPKTDELFYEALKAGPLYYSDLQVRVQKLLNCGTQMWNNMFREMHERGAIVRMKNREGKAVWQLAAMSGSSDGLETPEMDLFDQIAADLGESPSS